MIILTGNDLGTGDVVWWTGSAWSRNVDEAVDVGDKGDAIIAEEEAALRVISGYAIDAKQDDAGKVRPAHIKDRIRALGPTVRMDLSLKPNDAKAADWVV